MNERWFMFTFNKKKIKRWLETPVCPVHLPAAVVSDWKSEWMLGLPSTQERKGREEKSLPCLSLEVGFSCTPQRHSPAHHTGMRATTLAGFCFPEAPSQGLKIRRILLYSWPRSMSSISRHCLGGTVSTCGPSLPSCWEYLEPVCQVQGTNQLF